jgi:2-keto-myo-inositol isomerase
MRLGLNGATTLTATLATDIAVAGAAGYDFVEIWAGKLLGYLTEGGLPGLKRDLKRAGVRAATLNSVERVTFNDPSGRIRMREEFTRFCGVARGIGAETVLVVPSPKPPRVSHAAIERESVRILRELSDLASIHGVRLAYEFLGFADCTVNTLAQCAEIVSKVNRRNVGLVLDTFHFHAGGSTIGSIRHVDPAHIFMVHVNDVERGPRRKMHDALRLYPGQGVIPLRSILTALKGIGYGGDYSVEIFRPAYWRRQPKVVAIAARKAALRVLREAGIE